MTFDVQRGYAGDSPGQRLGAVLARLTSADLSAIVGPTVLPLLPSAPNASRRELIAAAERSFRHRAEELLSQPTLRKTLLRNLDAGKLDELKHRLVEGGIAVSLSAMEVAELTTGRAWPVVARFFGFAGEELAPAPAPLPREPIRPAFPLFPHQRSVVRKTYQKLSEPRGRTVIHMPTGAGKTRTAMHLVSRALNEVEPSLIVWLANSRELLEQAVETLETL